MEQVQKKNILGTEPIGGLLRQFAVPSIIAMLVGALYNIVDQFFIGRSVGELGNAATNVAFPLTISCVALALLFGIGGAASFNLTLGGGDREKALFYIGNAATLLFGSGVILGIVALLCLTPMLRFFGSPDNVLAYAKTYTGITALGFPFLILTNGGGHLVRADGSPRNAMLYNLSGALINTVYFWISYGNGGCCAGNDHWTDFFRNPDYPVSAPLQKRTADSGASSTTENICKHDYLIGGGGIFQSACDAGGADRVK